MSYKLSPKNTVQEIAWRVERLRTLTQTLSQVSDRYLQNEHDCLDARLSHDVSGIELRAFESQQAQVEHDLIEGLKSLKPLADELNALADTEKVFRQYAAPPSEREKGESR